MSVVGKSGDDLRVITPHLGVLAVRQGGAAEATRSATVATAGIDTAVAHTHGSIASATSSALLAALTSRHAAGDRMANVSDSLRDSLTDAATSYDRADEAAGAALDTAVRSA